VLQRSSKRRYIYVIIVGGRYGSERSEIALLVTEHLFPQRKTGAELAAAFRQWQRNLKVLPMSGLAEHELAGQRIGEGFFIAKAILPRVNSSRW